MQVLTAAVSYPNGMEIARKKAPGAAFKLPCDQCSECPYQTSKRPRSISPHEASDNLPDRRRRSGGLAEDGFCRIRRAATRRARPARSRRAIFRIAGIAQAFGRLAERRQRQH